MIEIRVIVPAYNAAPFIGQCLDSLAAQVYDGRWSAFVVEDCSTDGTQDALWEWARDHKGYPMSWGWMSATARSGGLASIVTGIRDGVGPLWTETDETVIAILGGDDYLPHPGVLAQIAAYYAPSECRPRTLMTYGSYGIDWNGGPGTHMQRGHCQELSAEAHEAGDYRDRPWVTSHMVTFRRGLWNRIPSYQLIDPATGKTWFFAADRASVYPMLEMARERAVYVDEILYTYRRYENNVPGWQDAEHCRRVAAMPRLERVEDWNASSGG